MKHTFFMVLAAVVLAMPSWAQEQEQIGKLFTKNMQYTAIFLRENLQISEFFRNFVALLCEN